MNSHYGSNVNHGVFSCLFCTATELVDKPVPVDQRPEQDCSRSQTPEGQPKEHLAVGQIKPEGLLSEVEALGSRMTSEELSHCSPEQLAHLHEHLGGMMRSVVVELQTRLCQRHNAP